MSDTPETDENEQSWDFYDQYGYHDSLADKDPIPRLELCEKLERERNEARRLAEKYRNGFTVSNRMSFLTKLPWEDK